MWSYNYNDELYHHGIKGMKWGIRRYEDKSGHLTAAGRKRYAGYDYSDGKSKKPSPPTVNIVKKAKNSKSESGKKETDVKRSEKSKHRQKLEDKYIKEGFSKNDAEKLADRRIKAEKVVAGAAAITLTAAAAYVANKQIKYRVDTMIKEGTDLHRVSTRKNVDLNNAIYTSHNKNDNLKYRGLLGSQKLGEKDIHSIDIKATKNLKVASRKHAEDAFIDLYKNDDVFKKNTIKTIEKVKHTILDPKLINDLDEFMKNPNSFSDKKLRSSIYDAFNIGLAFKDDDTKKNAGAFYDKLKSKGYDAIKDINDKKYSGYKTKTPTIVFNGKDKLSVSKIKELTAEQISKEYIDALNMIKGQEKTEELIKNIAIKTSSPLAGAVASGVGISAINTVAIKRYRRQHPNSKLTDKEIIKMLSKHDK